jgi:hypothetical protein
MRKEDAMGDISDLKAQNRAINGRISDVVNWITPIVERILKLEEALITTEADRNYSERELRLMAERDAALARAEKAEKERDEALADGVLSQRVCDLENEVAHWRTQADAFRQERDIARTNERHLVDRTSEVDRLSERNDALCVAVCRLLWRSVAVDKACTCDIYPNCEKCIECFAMHAIGLASWNNANDSARLLRAHWTERRRQADPPFGLGLGSHSVDNLPKNTPRMRYAHPKEMVFVLLSRDAAAPVAIRAWVAERLRLGKNVGTDAQIVEALARANTMETEGRLWPVSSSTRRRARSFDCEDFDVQGKEGPLMKLLEIALDAALAEIRRQGGTEYLLAEARSAGLVAAKALEAALIDRICFQIGQTHDTSELWAHMRRDPDAFRAAVRVAMVGHGG